MVVGIGNDHHGIDIKNKIIKHLEEKNIQYVNYGCDNKDNTDYVDYAIKLCKGIQSKEVSLGILICGTGIGMCIVANKFKGIRCGKVATPEEARLTKEHNMANVISLSEYTMNIDAIVDAFLDTKYSAEERHKRRVEKISRLENE